MNAQDRRLAAIATTVASFLNDKHKLRQDVDRADIADALYALAKLGRTDKWHGTIARWVALVLDSANPMDWALLQGQVFATNAA